MTYAKQQKIQYLYYIYTIYDDDSLGIQVMYDRV